jgi:CheY-like chemotaxis protein
MADGLAAYFNKPATLFLRRPHYAGKPLRCWEYFHCGQTSCAAYGSGELRCWLMPATHCKGSKVASYPDKVDFCKGCELIEMLMLESDELQEMQLREVAIQPAEQSPGKTVLAVDDNPEAIEIIRKYLGEEYQVVGLLGGENALKIAKELKPAAITLDIMMPMKDGWQVLQELKNDPETQDIPVMILSIVDQKQRGFSLGAAEYIVKPVEKGVLLRKLRNLARLSKIKTVLVVDNEWDSVTMIGEMLTAEGYDVMKAYSGREAIASMNDEPPDLVVLTLLMPEAGSIDVIEHIKGDERLRNVPVILVTQRDLSEERLTELNGRISGILNKSTLTTDELLCRLRDTIRRCEKA